MKEKRKKVNTSLRLEKKVIKALKLIAIENETSVQAIIESLIYDYLSRMKDKK